MSKPLKIFVTYSHENTEAKDELITHLAVMKREGLISIWHDNEITAGDTWRDAIFSNLDDSDILLYLVSAYSLASENCNKELAAALNADIRLFQLSWSLVIGYTTNSVIFRHFRTEVNPLPHGNIRVLGGKVWLPVSGRL